MADLTVDATTIPIAEFELQLVRLDCPRRAQSGKMCTEIKNDDDIVTVKKCVGVTSEMDDTVYAAFQDLLNDPGFVTVDGNLVDNVSFSARGMEVTWRHGEQTDRNRVAFILMEQI